MNWGLLFAASALAMAADPSFDVASLKPSPPPETDTININLGRIRNGEVTLGNATLTDCVKFAWELAGDEQVDGPDWIKGRGALRFDVIAKAAPSVPRDQLLLMLRTLLKERFHLEMHTEQRRFGHYALVVAKDGFKLKDAAAGPQAPPAVYALGRLTRPEISMQTLALLLSRQTRELVLDQTGLKGFYQLDLRWTPESQPGAPEPPENGPSLFTALQQQAGLRLEGRKDGVEVLVIDRADRVPEGN
jgi:uncharacterized protein (TIGR03435 family)